MRLCPSLINYQGRLKAKFGGNVNDTPELFTVSASMTGETGGKLTIRRRTLVQVSVVDGAYSLNFGENGIVEDVTYN